MRLPLHTEKSEFYVSAFSGCSIIFVEDKGVANDPRITFGDKTCHLSTKNVKTSWVKARLRFIEEDQ